MHAFVTCCVVAWSLNCIKCCWYTYIYVYVCICSIQLLPIFIGIIRYSRKKNYWLVESWGNFLPVFADFSGDEVLGGRGTVVTYPCNFGYLIFLYFWLKNFLYYFSVSFFSSYMLNSWKLCWWLWISQFKVSISGEWSWLDTVDVNISKR